MNFEPFFATKAVGRGSGQGLAMVNAFATALGGHVTARSPAGQGSVFALTLPAAAQGEPDHARPDDTPVESCPACNVLLVEDDEVVRITAIAMLQSLGHRVQACAEAGEALALLDRDGDVQVLFTDLMMPGIMGGLELALVARQRRPLLKVILTSGWADSEFESFSGVHEQRAKTCLIQAQSTVIARAMASICNDERVRLGAMSGHERKTFNLSDLPAHLRPGGTDVFVLKPYSLADLSRAFAAV